MFPVYSSPLYNSFFLSSSYFLLLFGQRLAAGRNRKELQEEALTHKEVAARQTHKLLQNLDKIRILKGTDDGWIHINSICDSCSVAMLQETIIEKYDRKL